MKVQRGETAEKVQINYFQLYTILTDDVVIRMKRKHTHTHKFQSL